MPIPFNSSFPIISAGVHANVRACVRVVYLRVWLRLYVSYTTLPAVLCMMRVRCACVRACACACVAEGCAHTINHSTEVSSHHERELTDTVFFQCACKHVERKWYASGVVCGFAEEKNARKHCTPEAIT